VYLLPGLRASNQPLLTLGIRSQKQNILSRELASALSRWRSLTQVYRTVKRKMPSRTASPVRNDYHCSMERNQSGKYCVRIQVHYPRHAWTLSVFFLASSFDRAMKKLEQSLDFLQRHEEKLWFWGVDRAEDLGFSAEFLKEAGLKLDLRTEFPRKATNILLSPEREVPAFVLGQMRRGLAESVVSPRAIAMAAAGD
jgi:hypothetical protein